MINWLLRDPGAHTCTGDLDVVVPVGTCFERSLD